MERIILKQISRKNKVKVLEIWTEEDTIYRRWGQEGGKMQESTKVCEGKNIGKSNETSPKQQASQEAMKIVERKKREGYSEGEAQTGSKPVGELTLNPLPTSFAPSKPYTDKPKDVETNMKDYCAERKNNGSNLLRVVDEEGYSHIYTRGIKEITDIVRGTNGVREILDFCSIKVPKNTILSYEFVHYDATGKEIPKELRGILNERTTAEKAQARYQKLLDEGSTFGIKLFDVLILDNEIVATEEYHVRRQLMQQLVWGKHPEYQSEYFPKLNQQVIDKAKRLGWEGLVLRKLTGGDSTVEFTLNGKPYRRGAWKYVFYNTEDFFVTETQIGDSGRLQGLPAKFHLIQYDNDGNEIDCGWAGPGKLTTKELEDLSSWEVKNKEPKAVIDIRGSELVAEIVYKERQPDTDALEHPVIQRLRTDKPVKECLYGENR